MRISLNNNMCICDTHPGNADLFAPGTRMLGSISPTLLFKGGQLDNALGTPACAGIFPAVLQAIINVIDRGMTP